MKQFITIILLLIVTGGTAFADDTKEAELLVHRNIDRVVAVLENKHVKEKERMEQVDAIVAPLFDFQLMAKLSLGRNVWPAMTAEQQQQFTASFIGLFKRSYLDRMLLYSGEKVLFEEASAVGKKVYVPTVLLADDRRITMHYKLYKSDNTWKIYDIEVEGVSLLLSYRNQFAEVLKTATVVDLLKNLEAKAE